MDCCIFVASHIRYEGQLKLLKECLNSLLEQSYKADVFVSISFENDYYQKDFNDTIYNFYQDVVFFKQPTQKYQLEHLKILCNKIKDMNKYRWVFFCDDDDKYYIHRVETFIKYIKNENEKIIIIKEKGKYEGVTDIDILIYWLYAIEIDLLAIFFNKLITNNKVLKDYNADYLLKSFFENCHNTNNNHLINDELYIYNQSNLKSISKTIVNEYKKILYYNVINCDEKNNNIEAYNLRTKKSYSLTKKDYILNVPYYHHLKDTLKKMESFINCL